MPAARARAADQCGAGCVSGTPGASTSADSLDQSTSRRSAVGMPALVALTTESALSSQPMTSAPPASSALALASPDPPRPKMATFLPAKTLMGIMRRGCLRRDRRGGEGAAELPRQMALARAPCPRDAGDIERKPRGHASLCPPYRRPRKHKRMQTASADLPCPPRRSPQFQRGQPGEREHDRDDPETDH